MTRCRPAPPVAPPAARPAARAAAATALGGLAAADVAMLPELLTVQPGLGDAQALLCLVAVATGAALLLDAGRTSWRLAGWVAVAHVVLAGAGWRSSATQTSARVAAALVTAIAAVVLGLVISAGRAARRRARP